MKGTIEGAKAHDVDVVTPEMKQTAKGNDITFNLKKKHFRVCYHDEEKLFPYGAKVLTMPGLALQMALEERANLKGIEDLVATWSKEVCATYLREHGLSVLSRKKLEDRQAKIIAHMWIVNGNPKEKATPSESATPSVEPQDGAAHNPCKGKGASLFSEGKTLPEGAAVEDVTDKIFRQSSSKEMVPTCTTKGSANTSEISDKCRVILPRVTIVKYLEAVNLTPADTNIVTGDLLGIEIDKGKHKGKILVRALFVGDPHQKDDVNDRERAEWIAYHGLLRPVGRPDSFVYVMFILYI